MSAQEERDRAACLEGAHGETTYDEKTFAACMTARGYSEDKLYAGGAGAGADGTAAAAAKPPGSDARSGATASLGGNRAIAPTPPGSAARSAAPLELNGPAARENYDRAVADYQACLLDHTSNLSQCEKQRAVMNTEAKILFGSSGPKGTIVGVEQ
jgi:hypothetical protein